MDLQATGRTGRLTPGTETEARTEACGVHVELTEDDQGVLSKRRGEGRGIYVDQLVLTQSIAP